MSQNDKESVRHWLEDEIYVCGDITAGLPEYRFPGHERNPRQNLATFCQTGEEPEIHQLVSQRIDKNMVDKDEYPQTAEIEARCLHMLSGLWHSPAGKDGVGCSATDSSEAAMLGGMAMKRRWEAAGIHH